MIFFVFELFSRAREVGIGRMGCLQVVHQKKQQTKMCVSVFLCDFSFSFFYDAQDVGLPVLLFYLVTMFVLSEWPLLS